MLTEDEYLAIAERYQRASMGDGSVMRQLLMVDFARLLADWREWERLLKRAEQPPEPGTSRTPPSP